MDTSSGLKISILISNIDYCICLVIFLLILQHLHVHLAINGNGFVHMQCRYVLLDPKQNTCVKIVKTIVGLKMQLYMLNMSLLYWRITFFQYFAMIFVLKLIFQMCSFIFFLSEIRIGEVVFSFVGVFLFLSNTWREDW